MYVMGGGVCMFAGACMCVCMMVRVRVCASHSVTLSDLIIDHVIPVMQCLANTNEAVVRSTVARLPAPLVLTFLQLIVGKIQVPRQTMHSLDRA